MAQTNYTPIQLYYSTTRTAVPSASSLVPGELALNITDGNLYFKDNTNTVQLIASTAGVGGVKTFAGGATGLTPADPTTGAISLGGVLNIANGGTGLSSFAQGDLFYYGGGSTFTKLAIGEDGTYLTSSGTDVFWSFPVTAVQNLGGGLPGSIPFQSQPSTTSFLNIGTTNSVLVSTGTSPAWSSTPTLSSVTATGDSQFTSTGSLLISTGTTLQQPVSPVVGMIRYNTDINSFEGYSGSPATWNPIGGNGTGTLINNDTTTNATYYPTFVTAYSGAVSTLKVSEPNYTYNPATGQLNSPEFYASNGLFINQINLSNNFTIPPNSGAMSVGPITMVNGAVITIGSGSRWVIL